MRHQQPKVGEGARHVVEQHRPPIHQDGVRNRRGREVNHHRDVELLGHVEDGEGQVAIVDRVMVVHRIQLEPGQSQLGHGPLQLGDRRSHAAILGIDRGHPNELVRILLG